MKLKGSSPSKPSKKPKIHQNSKFRYDNQFQDGGDCVTAQYTLNVDGSITVFNTKRLIGDQRWETDTGIAWIAFPDENPLRGEL